MYQELMIRSLLSLGYLIKRFVMIYVEMVDTLVDVVGCSPVPVTFAKQTKLDGASEHPN